MAKRNAMRIAFNKGEHFEGRADLLPLYLEESSTSSSCWFRDLPVFVIKGINSIKGLLDVQHRELFNVAPENRVLPTGTYTAKVCPGIAAILSNSVLVKCPVDLVISINSDGSHAWRASGSDLLNVLAHPREQLEVSSDKSDIFKSKIALKVEMPISMSSGGAYSYVCLPAQYHHKNPYTIPIGVITPSFKEAVNLNVIILLDLPTQGQDTYYIKKGEVLAYLWSDNKIKLKPQRLPLSPPPLRLKFLRGYT